MRSIIGLLVVMIGMFLSSPGDMRAQCPPDRDGCAGTPWVAVNTSVILSTGCVMEVAYRVRECPGKPCEIALDGMTATYSTDGCQQCDPVLDGTSLKQVTDEVLRWILSRDRGTVPCGSVNGQQVSVARPTCWQHAVVAGRRVYAPCGGCCIMLVRVMTNTMYTTLILIGPDLAFAPNPINCGTPPPAPPCALEIPACPPPDAGDPNNWLFGIDQY